MANFTGFLILGASGFAIGMLIGMAIRAVIRVIMYVVGLYLASLVVLSSMGLIIVNWEGIAALVGTIINFMMDITSSGVIPSAGAFGISTFLGMIYGATKSRVNVPKNRNNYNYRFFKKLN